MQTYKKYCGETAEIDVAGVTAVNIVDSIKGLDYTMLVIMAGTRPVTFTILDNDSSTPTMTGTFKGPFTIKAGKSMEVSISPALAVFAINDSGDETTSKVKVWAYS